MTGPQAAAPPSAQRTASRTAGLRQASLAILIVLIVQFALGIGVNLYVTLPAAGHPGHSSWFGNGPLLAMRSGAYRRPARRVILEESAWGSRPNGSDLRPSGLVTAPAGR
jgi:hypothetical protein